MGLGGEGSDDQVLKSSSVFWTVFRLIRSKNFKRHSSLLQTSNRIQLHSSSILPTIPLLHSQNFIPPYLSSDTVSCQPKKVQRPLPVHLISPKSKSNNYRTSPFLRPQPDSASNEFLITCLLLLIVHYLFFVSLFVLTHPFLSFLLASKLNAFDVASFIEKLQSKRCNYLPLDELCRNFHPDSIFAPQAITHTH
jgi:hypothetical protein